VEEAQDKICPQYKVYEPDPSEQRVYDDLYRLFVRLYFSFGEKAGDMGDVLPALIGIAERRHKSMNAS
jgi:L-ribulokinase